jgi:TorA maturation chaperone TorD
MQVVAAQRAAAIYQNDHEAAETLADAEATILDEHLAAFVPSFAIDLRAATSNDVYKAASTLAERLVSEDHADHDTAQTAPPEVGNNV